MIDTGSMHIIQHVFKDLLLRTRVDPAPIDRTRLTAVVRQTRIVTRSRCRNFFFNPWLVCWGVLNPT